jgi:hypothetical protein
MGRASLYVFFNAMNKKDFLSWRGEESMDESRGMPKCQGKSTHGTNAVS